MIAVDLYADDAVHDLGQIYRAGPPWSLIALKASQGVSYHAPAWFNAMWSLAKTVAGDDYGKRWFRVAYHYLDVSIDGTKQGDFFCQQIQTAGGTGKGDPFLMVDVERGGQRAAATRDQVVACARAFVARVKARSGLRVVTYGGEYLRELGIHISEFGSEYAWVADYEAHLRPTHYTDLGIDLAHLLGWQYGGVDGRGQETAFLNGYPHATPAGPADLTALTLGGGGVTAITTLASWCAAGQPQLA